MTISKLGDNISGCEFVTYDMIIHNIYVSMISVNLTNVFRKA